MKSYRGWIFIFAFEMDKRKKKLVHLGILQYIFVVSVPITTV